MYNVVLILCIYHDMLVYTLKVEVISNGVNITIHI